MDHGSGHDVNFSDVFAGVALGHAFSEHGFAHTSFADLVTEAGFISWALDSPGTMAHGGGLSGMPAPPGSYGFQAPDQSSHTDWTRSVNLPGIARNAEANPRAVWTLFWPHGQCKDGGTRIRAQLGSPRDEIHRIATRLGLARHADYNDGYVAMDAALDGIRLIPSQWPRGPVDAKFWDHYAERVVDSGDNSSPGMPHKDVQEQKRDNLERNRRRPNGWFPGAFGSSYFWSDYYAAGSISANDFRRTFLMVAGATWCYEMTWKSKPTCDFETLIAFTIICNPYPTPIAVVDALLRSMAKDPAGPTPGHPLAAELRSYRTFAETMAAQTYEYLKQRLSAADALGFRLTLAQQRSASEIHTTHVIPHK